MSKHSPRKPIKRIIFSYQLLSNIGCEIIIRGSIAFLNRAFPEYELRFTVSSYHLERDCALLSDLPNVEVVPMLQRKRILRGILRKTGLFVRYWTPRFASGHFRQADLFVSVGGDIYTMFGNALPDDWLGYESYATRHGIPAMMLGANMEKFDVLSESDRTKLLSHLNEFRLIAVRDCGTRDYLATYGVTANVTVFPDPIFSLRPKTIFQRQPIRTIGFNFTPYMIKHFGEKIIDTYAGLIAGLVGRGYSVRFVPHVYASDGNPNIDDRVALRALHAALPSWTREKVHLFEEEMSLARIGEVLKHIDLFVGARMHGCLNSLTLGKAVCFLGYSKKAETMVDWLKRDSPFAAMRQSFDVIPAGQLDGGVLDRLISAHDAWAESGRDPMVVDTEAALAMLPIWGRLSDGITL